MLYMTSFLCETAQCRKYTSSISPENTQCILYRTLFSLETAQCTMYTTVFSLETAQFLLLMISLLIEIKRASKTRCSFNLCFMFRIVIRKWQENYCFVLLLLPMECRLCCMDGILHSLFCSSMQSRYTTLFLCSPIRQ